MAIIALVVARRVIFVETAPNSQPLGLGRFERQQYRGKWIKGRDRKTQKGRSWGRPTFSQHIPELLAVGEREGSGFSRSVSTGTVWEHRLERRVEWQLWRPRE
jgi:hypothetical protein